MKDKKLISVIMPVYNRERLITESLESLQAQTFKNWECIVVDDGSRDNTVKVVKSYEEKDDRVKLFQRPPTRTKGASPCRNYGLEQAKGDFVQFLDSDDLLKENKFEAQLKILENSGPLAISTSKWGSFKTSSYLNVKEKYNSYRNFKNSLELFSVFAKHDEYFPPFVYLVPKEVISRAGYWDESLKKNPNDDGEYFSRVVRESSEIAFCNTTEGYYRAGDEDRLSLLDDPQKIRSAIESWRMIGENLKDHPGIRNQYVRKGIRSIYERSQDIYPEIKKEYEKLFLEYKNSETWYDKLFNRLKK